MPLLPDSWDSRMGFKSHIDVATGLIPTGYLPQVALKQIDITLSQLTEERIPVWKALLQEMKANRNFQPGHARRFAPARRRKRPKRPESFASG